MNVPTLLLQVVLTVPTEGVPIRLGVPLPASAVTDGLRLVGAGAMQWRRLPIGGPAPDPVWVEIAIVGARGAASVARGGAPPDDDRAGPAFGLETSIAETERGTERRTIWRWNDGTTDERLRTVFRTATVVGAETFAPDEAHTVDSPAMQQRAPLWRLSHRFFTTAGLLPPPGGLGAEVRKQLVAALPHLRELGGERGAGDFARSGGTVTNLEFDTTLGLLRCAVAFGDAGTLALARRCARHLVDRDLDPRSGLPFPHGPGHRTGTPESGHAWLQGVLWTGLLTADDDLIVAAKSIGRALAAYPPRGEREQERARDYAWPLLEMEALLAFDPDPIIAAAADRLAVAIGSRYDAAAHTFRFGEGEVERGVYLERAWVTAGIVVPALRANLARRRDRDLAERVDDVQRFLVQRLDSPIAGIATHWRTAGGRVFAEHRARGEPDALLVFDALSSRDLRRVLQREGLRHAMDETLRADDPDLATSFSIAARARWVWQ